MQSTFRSKLFTSDRCGESQTLESSIANFSSRALGLKGIDVLVCLSHKSPWPVDRAVRRGSSERSKLGSLQNRLTSTINNLTVTTKPQAANLELET